jgi:protocatechuate 3,4-dioxygenase beta subunit
VKPRATSSQTVGPFFAGALLEERMTDLARDATRGERITIEGRVLDGDGAAVPDAMVEVWQARTRMKRGSMQAFTASAARAPTRRETSASTP